MRVTTFTDYSLRMLIHVATAPQGRATIAQVAEAFDISQHHLVKVAQFLGREGFLVNTRGRGGGLSLSAGPAEINVGRVVRATESAEIAECFNRERDACAISGICRLAGVLAEAMEAFYRVLDGYTLEDLVTNRHRAAVVRVLHRQAA